MKRCPRCDQWLDLSEFSPNRSRRDGLQAYCRACQRAYVRGHYESNRDYYIAKAKTGKTQFRERMKLFLAQFKDVPCADCGGVFPPWVMDFDHVQGPKLINVSDAAKHGCTRIRAEASKCELVCANCHRRRTHDRLRDGKSSDRSRTSSQK